MISTHVRRRRHPTPKTKDKVISERLLLSALIYTNRSVVRERTLNLKSDMIMQTESFNATTECHILPCSIGFTGKAPTHVYFQPSTTNHNDSLAAQFRGRGLLAVVARPVHGKIVHADGKQLITEASFESMTEWHHEHQPEALERKSTDERVARASEWCQIAAALHQPIPVADHEDNAQID